MLVDLLVCAFRQFLPEPTLPYSNKLKHEQWRGTFGSTGPMDSKHAGRVAEPTSGCSTTSEGRVLFMQGSTRIGERASTRAHSETVETTMQMLQDFRGLRDTLDQLVRDMSRKLERRPHN